MNQARHIVKTDISQFYASIYTHAIAWAVEGKETCKARVGKRLPPSFGESLDHLVRRTTANQTKGIPVGPDTSFLIAEAMLAAVDARLQSKFPGIERRALRIIDDYEVGCSSLAQAEDVIIELENELRRYELSINNEKTLIDTGPGLLDATWKTTLDQFVFSTRDGGADPGRIQSFISLGFDLARQNPGAAVVSYAISQCVARVRFGRRSWGEFARVLLPAALAEPACLKFVAFALDFGARHGFTIETERLNESLQDLILHHARLEQGTEVVWSMYALAMSGGVLDKAAADQVSRMRDNFATTLLVAMSLAGRSDPTVDLGGLIDRARSPGALLSEDWLLAYECARMGQCGRSQLSKDPFFRAMRSADVRFLDLDLSKIPVASTVRVSFQQLGVVTSNAQVPSAVAERGEEEDTDEAVEDIEEVDSEFDESDGLDDDELDDDEDDELDDDERGDDEDDELDDDELDDDELGEEFTSGWPGY